MKAIALAILLPCVVVAAVDPLLESFQERLDAYVKLRKAAADSVPALKKNASAQEIQNHDLALADAIRKARPNAKPGNIVSPDVKPVFAKLLRHELTGPGSQKTKASIKEGNPKNEKAAGEVEPVIAVNAVYPKNAPLSTVPPSLLLRLPKLPKDIEYRFVGRTMILRDRQADLIIDYMKEAVPAS
jgi:hypothetical protein